MYCEKLCSVTDIYVVYLYNLHWICLEVAISARFTSQTVCMVLFYIYIFFARVHLFSVTQRNISLRMPRLSNFTTTMGRWLIRWWIFGVKFIPLLLILHLTLLLSYKFCLKSVFYFFPSSSNFVRNFVRSKCIILWELKPNIKVFFLFFLSHRS